MNIWSLWVLFILLGGALLELVIEGMNLKAIRDEIPSDFADLYDREKYSKSQHYLKARTRFGLIRMALNTSVLLGLIYSGAFGAVQRIALQVGHGPILSGLVFFGIFGAASWLWSLPFSYYSTFVIEEKFGFNRTTPTTFAVDQARGVILAILVGLPLAAGLLAFFEYGGAYAWVWAWIGMVAFEILISFIAPVWIMPIFNKFTPLADGELKSAIEDFARKEKFSLQGVFTMDGSKRSTKANAFFTGFGRYRRIVLFDTLIAKHSVEELVAVLAHEVGHFKKRHVLKGLIFSVFSTGVLLGGFALLSKNVALAQAFGANEVTLAGNLLFFVIVYAPVSGLFSLWSLWRSRVHEFEADEFAAERYGKPNALANALKKLSVDGLSNLHPHPLKVFFEYTHPPVLARTARLHAMADGSA